MEKSPNEITEMAYLCLRYAKLCKIHDKKVKRMKKLIEHIENSEEEKVFKPEEVEQG